MAFTKVVGAGIHTLSNIASHNINSSGIITATKFVGPMEGNVTAVDGVFSGNLTVQGTTTTLDTNLIDVDRIAVGTTGNNVAVAVTQSGSGDLIRLYDGSTQVVTVDDEGKVGIGTDVPSVKLDVEGTGTLAKFGTYGEQLFIKTNVAGYPSITNDSSHDTIELRSGGSVQVAIDYNNNMTDKYFRVVSNGQGTSGTELFRVQENGRVGIATADPKRTLHVVDTVGEGIAVNGATSGIQFGLVSMAGASYNAILSRVGTNDQYVAGTEAGDLCLAPEREGAFVLGLSPHLGAMTVGVRIDRLRNYDIYFNNHIKINTGSPASPSEKLRITSLGKVGISTGTIDPDGNQLLIRAASTVGTTKGHIMLTGDGATNGEGPQIVFSESGSGSNFAGAYIGHIRATTNSVGHLVFGTRGTSGDANTVPTERLRITSEGNVNIGGEYTQTTYPFQLTGSGGGDAAAMAIKNLGTHPAKLHLMSGHGNWSVSNSTTVGDAFEVRDEGANSTRMIIKSDGHVGIGTDNPSYVLHTLNGGVVGSTENNRKYNGRFTTYTPNRLNFDIYDRRWQDTQTHGWIGTEKRIEYNVDDNNDKRMWISFFNPSSTTADNVIRFGEHEDTEWMRIDNGKVGIDQDNPNTMLDIKVPPLNTATISTTNCLQLGLLLTAGGTGSNTEGHIYNGLAVGDGYAGLYGKDGGSGAATDLEFFTGTSSAVAGRMRIQDDGKIIIGGNVSQSINRSVTVVAASGNSQSVEIGLQPTNSSGGYNPEVYISSVADGTYGAQMGFHTRNTSGARAERFGIASSGNIRWRNGAVLQRKASAFLGISGAGTSDIKISGNFEANDMLRVRWAYNWNAGDGGAWGEAIIWKMYESTVKVRYLTDVKAAPLTSVSFPHSGNDIWLRWQTNAGINGYYMIDVETAGCEPFPF